MAADCAILAASLKNSPSMKLFLAIDDGAGTSDTFKGRCTNNIVALSRSLSLSLAQSIVSAGRFIAAPAHVPGVLAQEGAGALSRIHNIIKTAPINRALRGPQLERRPQQH